MVRAVDARAIVDEVGCDPPALRREGDARCLGDAKVRALADRLDAQILGIDAQRVVRGVADLGVVLARGLHIGADAAEPDEIDRRLQNSRDQRTRVAFGHRQRSEEHTSELQSLLRNPYAVFGLTKNTHTEYN